MGPDRQLTIPFWQSAFNLEGCMMNAVLRVEEAVNLGNQLLGLTYGAILACEQVRG
jgi:hypothetical protein